MKKLILLLIMTICLGASQGCRISYKFNGAALDYNLYKTVHIGEFPIRAALVYAPLQQTFENELTDYVTRNTRLRVVDGAADLELEGEITGYTLTPQAVTEDAYASMTRLTITVRANTPTPRRMATMSTRVSRPTAISRHPRCLWMCRRNSAARSPRSWSS